MVVRAFSDNIYLRSGGFPPLLAFLFARWYFSDISCIIVTVADGQVCAAARFIFVLKIALYSHGSFYGKILDKLRGQL